MLREGDIRPPELMARLKRLAQEDRDKLLARAAEFVSVACPACASSAGSFRFGKDGFQFHECRECGTLYISPRPPAGLLGLYYATAESLKFWATHIFPASAEARRERIFKPRLAMLQELLRSQPVEVLVDVGAGFGWFAGLVAAEGLARRVVAVEPNPELAAACRGVEGLEVIESVIEDCSELLQADVITCFELLEHVFAPLEVARACYRGLKPGGLFLCSTPNWRGFDIALLGPRSDNVAGPNHLQLFHPYSLRCMLQKAGFVEVSVSTPGYLDVDIIYKRGSSLFRVGRLSLPKDVSNKE